MMTKLPYGAMPPPSTVDVGCCATGGSVHLYGRDPDSRREWRRSLDPAAAAAIWSVLNGETGRVKVADVHDDEMTCYVALDKFGLSDTDNYILEDANGSRLLVLTPAQAQALQWAIERACADALAQSSAGACAPETRAAPREVWVLAARCVLTGDTAAEGVDLVGGHEEVFASRADAMASLRAFLRPLVLCSYDDERFDEALCPADDYRPLDEVIDAIMDDEGHPDTWLHDGYKQSFEVTLTRKEVRSCA